MINAIQAGVVEVENSSKEPTSSAASGFTDVFEKAVSRKAVQQESGGGSANSGLASAKTGGKSKSEAPKGRTEREQVSGEGTSMTLATSVATPVQVISAENRVADAAHVMTLEASGMRGVVAEKTRAEDVRATAASGVEELETGKGSRKVVHEGEDVALNGSAFLSEKIPGAIAREAKDSFADVKGKANEKGPEKSSGEKTVTDPSENPLKECEIVATVKTFDENLNEPTRTEGQQKSSKGSAVAKLEKEPAAIAERPAKPQDAQSYGTTAKPANKTESEKALEQAVGRGGEQQVKAQRSKGEKIPTASRKESLGQSVQIGNKKTGSKVAASTDEDSLAAKANIKRAVQLENHATDKSRTIQETPGAVDSAGSRRFASPEGPVVSANVAVMDRAKDAGPKPSQLTQGPGGSVGSHMVETSARMPESFVPGGVQLLSRLSHQEMRFGWNSPDFGHVEVRATVDHDRVGAVVSADARLCDSLQADLGSLSRSLANQSLELAHFQTSNSGSGGSAGRDQNAGAQNEKARSDVGNWRPREIREPVLSIHQGALDLRA